MVVGCWLKVCLFGGAHVCDCWFGCLFVCVGVGGAGCLAVWLVVFVCVCVRRCLCVFV